MSELWRSRKNIWLEHCDTEFDSQCVNFPGLVFSKLLPMWHQQTVKIVADHGSMVRIQLQIADSLIAQLSSGMASNQSQKGLDQYA